MKLIVACDPLGGIGYNNKLPWNKIRGDLPRFKTLTNSGIVVMGRNTWESLPNKPLPGRLNFIVTSQELDLPDGAIAVPNLNHFRNFKNVWMIGGAQLINSSWDMIDEIHLTKTTDHYFCDSFIDLLYLEDNYTCTFIEAHGDHSYQIWKRK